MNLENVQDKNEDNKVKEAILKREKEISALLEASRAVLKYSDFKTSSKAIFDACTELIGVPAGYVALLTPDKKENLVVFLNPGNYLCTVDPDLPMPIRGMRGEVVKSKKPLYNNNFPETDWLRFMPNGHVDLENVLFTPLIINDEVLGLIGMANKPGGFTEEDAKLAMAFTEFVSIALQNSQMLESLENSEQKYKILSQELEQKVIERTKKLKKSEELFRNQSQFLNNILESLTHPFYVINTKTYKLDLVNSAAYSRGLLHGKFCYSVTHNRNKPCESPCVCPLEEVKRTKEGCLVEHTHYDSNDEARVYEIHGYPILDQNKEVVQMIEYSLDITNRKKAEKELQLERDNFLNILKSMEDGVYIVDQKFDIKYVNPSLIKEFGQFEGMKCFKYFEDRNEVCPRCKNREVFQGKMVREEWFSFKNQKTYDLINTPLKNPDGSISKLGILRDATEKKQAEKMISDLSKFPAENPNPVLRVSKEKVLYANSKAVDLLNITENKDLPPILKEKIHETFSKKSMVMFDIKLNNYTYSIVITPIINEGYANIYGRNITKRKEMEEKYRKQNIFLSNILESLTHPFYVINADDYTVALANFTASSEGLELGQYCYSLTHNNDKPCEAPCKCPLEEVKKTKKTCVVEHIHYDKEGNEKIYEIYGYPILDESGNVVQMIEYALNITDRKIAQQELKKSEKNYRDLFENSPISLWEQDYSEIKNYIDKLKNSGINDLRTYFDQNPEEVKKCVSMVKIININQETIKLFKANKKEDFFTGLNIVFTEESFDTFKEQIINFAGGKKRFESETVNCTINGDKLSIFIVCEIVAGFKDDWSKILISIVDISEIKKAEQIIQNEITKLRELDQLKNEFIVRTSHELKTPLVSICGSVEFLLNYIKEDFSMKSRAHLETINSGGKRLRKLVDNMLDILRIESRKFEINVETINLGNTIKKCIFDLKYLAEEREITISTSLQHELYVKVDEVKIEQVLVNLLSNALKYTPPYGHISISSEQAQGYINIKFTDTGAGFTVEEKTIVFEKFGKIERYGKGMDIITEGSGIGLYLSKKIVELHGGKIRLESEGKNKGSTFIVSLPIDEM